MTLPVAVAARFRGIPIIHEVNGPCIDILTTYPWLRLFEAPLRVLQRTQYVWADALIAVTPQLKAWLRDQLPPRYAVFFRGFARWQGIHTMIEATSSDSWPKETCLVFVGDGQLRSAVEEATRTHLHIRYIGELPYREVATVVVGREEKPWFKLIAKVLKAPQS